MLRKGQMLKLFGIGVASVLTLTALPLLSKLASTPQAQADQQSLEFNPDGAPVAARDPLVSISPGTTPSPGLTPTATPSGLTPSQPTVSKSAGAPPPPPAGNQPPPSGWRLVWSDEFNDSTIDRSKWNLRDEGRDIDLGCNTSRSQNQFESNGVLTIRALRENWTCGGSQRSYTEGYLDTIGRASWTYGRFEMRAQSPNKPEGASRGLWPAFWLRPNDGGNGEIDVVELPGGSSNSYWKKATQAIFWDYKPTKQDQQHTFSAGYPGDGFHTYTTEWERGVLRWYIDGKLVYTRDRGTTPWFDSAFSKPYNLRLNFQVGGWLGNPDANTSFPADFRVDYIRVYQR